MIRLATLLLIVPTGASAQVRPPEPKVHADGKALEFDFPGLLIGTAEYDEGPTGVTVFYFPAGVIATVDVRGGAPGTVNTDWLRLGYESRTMRAIVLSGGASHGLSAVTGVADAIRAAQVDSGGTPRIVGVAGAIVNDLGQGTGARRFSPFTPDAKLGTAALRAARAGRFVLGAHGAGRYVMTGTSVSEAEFSGQGGAFRQIGPTRIAVFTIVNAGGLVVDRGGQIVRCLSERWRPSCGSIADFLRKRVDSITARMPSGAVGPPRREDAPSPNTTITLVVTNQKLDWSALQRLASQVHTSMARAIQPFATQRDGDVLYAATTNEVDNPALAPDALGLAASEVAWDAVLASVPPSEPRADTTRFNIDPRTLEGHVGDYALGPGSVLSMKREGARLFAASQQGGIYVPADSQIDMTPLSNLEFVLATRRRDRVRFVRDASGRTTGLIINPGRWQLTAGRAAAK